MQKVLDMILIDIDNTCSNDMINLLSRKMKYLFIVERCSGFTVYQMAYIVENYEILHTIEGCEESLTSMDGSKQASCHVKKNITSQSIYGRECQKIGKVLKSCL